MIRNAWPGPWEVAAGICLGNATPTLGVVVVVATGSKIGVGGRWTSLTA